ncbi:uncharacterized protein LOC108846404 isoform X2 [Raphanus sativus]|uniref:Uncharacterized protein LOC108846404 isoform X2 n=1 Tax=Raphanus sativus TaxID=3726 RepID=A0A6J0MSK6_RAPSA|nr:uncharacterized protein LOC108846404 isoform X2 [Raphanus sativus]
MIISSSILPFRIFKEGEEHVETLIVQFAVGDELVGLSQPHTRILGASNNVHITSIIPADIDFELDEGELCFSNVEHVTSLVHEKVKGNIDRLEGKVSYQEILYSVCKSRLNWLCVIQCFNLCNYQVSSVELLQVV